MNKSEKPKRFKRERREDLLPKIIGVTFFIIFMGAYIGLLFAYLLDEPPISEKKVDSPNMVQVGIENDNYQYMVDKNSNAVYLFYSCFAKEAISPVLNKDNSVLMAKDIKDINNIKPDIIYISEDEEGRFYIFDRTTKCVFLFSPEQGNGLMAPAYSENGLPMQFEE